MKKRKSSPQKLAYMKRYRLQNLDRERQRVEAWYAIPENRKKALDQQKIYNRENPDVNKRATSRYRQKHRIKLRELNRLKARKLRAEGKPQKRDRERRATDPIYNLSRRIRSRINMAFYKAKKGTRKHTTAIQLLGCSYAEFKRHIESQFTEGMSWEKVIDGSIHIDHIKPVSSFDLTDSLQQKAAFHFTNCQPMWAVENLEKGRKIIPFEAAA